VATPPQKPTMQRGTPNAVPVSNEEPTAGTSQIGASIFSSVTPTPLLVRPKASVEIETMAKGTPKVTVRVDDDNPWSAASQALLVYQDTVKNLDEILNPAKD